MIGLPKQGLLIASAAVALFGFYCGWTVRDWKAEADLNIIAADLASAAEHLRDRKAKVEAAQAATAQASTDRLDAQAAATEKEIVYVDREVIRYRDRWRDSACRLPADWLRLYNQSLGLGDGAVPDPADL